MADEIYLGGEKPKAIHPADQFAAKCVDAIDLGENPETYAGKPPKLKHKGVVVWMTGEINPDTQRPFEVSVEYTLSMFDGSNLRRDLESWRGKPYTDAEVEAGDIPLHKLVGQWCLLTIAHAPTQKGRLRAKVMSVVKLPKGLPVPELPPYKRAEFWDKKKAEYAEAVAKFRHQDTQFAQEHAEEKFPEAFEDFPETFDAQDLPF